MYCVVFCMDPFGVFRCLWIHASGFAFRVFFWSLVIRTPLSYVDRYASKSNLTLNSTLKYRNQ